MVAITSSMAQITCDKVKDSVLTNISSEYEYTVYCTGKRDVPKQPGRNWLKK